MGLFGRLRCVSGTGVAELRHKRIGRNHTAGILVLRAVAETRRLGEWCYRLGPGRKGRGSQRRDPRYGVHREKAVIPQEFWEIGFVWSFSY